MFRCKRDVDRHVAELQEKITSTQERSLKFFTVARLYFNVGEGDLALKYLDKYCEARPSSAPAFKFRGQVLEKAAERESDEEQILNKKSAALEAYKTSYHLDLSQKEILVKVCDLTNQLPAFDPESTRYWLDQAEKQFPRNNVVTKLRAKMRSVHKNGDNGFNGNGQADTEDSPGSGGQEDDVEADNSILWSTSRLGGSFALNGSYRLEDALNSTPGRSSATTNRRFPPRPSPERLANQLRQVESAQEKMSSAILENSRSLLETQETILSELRKTREDVSRNLRENTEAVRDLRGELGSIWREMREELRRNANKKQEVIVVKDEKPSAPVAAPPPATSSSGSTTKPLDMQDLQEALAQQAALIQMSSLSMAGMFAQAARPPVPLGGVHPPPHPMPHMFPPMPAQPPLPQHPVPPAQAMAAPASVAPHPQPSSNTPANVVITSSDKIPATSTPTASLPAVSIPPQHRFGSKPVVASEGSPFQINMGAKPGVLSGSPFAEKEGPAVPISTSSILANIPAPVISAVTPKSSVNVTPQQPAKPTPTTITTSSSFDKFKPKAGSWECSGCFIRQDAEVIQCPACQTAKPGHEEEIKAKEEASKPALSFGADGGFKFTMPGSTGGNNNATPGGGFSFGTPDKATSTPTPAAAAAAAANTPKQPSPFTGFSFGGIGGGEQKTPATGGFSFGGLGGGGSGAASVSTPTFSMNTSGAGAQEEKHDESHDDSTSHDPHFEPIIPLPELVTVTTGEEEEEIKFQHRAKVFRFDKDTKEWKERGVGDLKILHHPQKNTYRVLLRRDQVLKIACNHNITADMKLEPMAKSETAVTWFAMDYSEEGEAKIEKLAARFKLAETKDEFKKAFEEAQEALKNKPPSPQKPASQASSTSVVTEDNTSSELSFDGQGLKLNTAQDAQGVVAKINSTKNITTLTFSGNTVGIDAAEAIGKALEKHPELQYAHWKDMFTGRMKTEIPPALKHLSRGLMTANARLVELDLSDNALGPIGMDGIVDLLKSPCCYSLKELKLNNTGCGVTGGKLLAKTLMETYNASKGQLTLRVFVLGRSRQENDGAIALAGVFKAMKSLEEVVMPQNGIFHEGITALADAFAHNPNLRILNMNDNTLTEKGAKALADALPKMQKLEVLNLGDCLLKTEGARLIAYAVKDGHKDLREWHMDSNEIRLAGGFAIVDAVANKTNMKVLTLDTNQFGAEGCGRILKKLETMNKRHLMEDIEDDEEPEDSEEEDDEDYEDEEEEEEESETTTEKVENLSSFSFSATSTANKPASNIFGGSATSKDTSSVADKTSSSIFEGLKLSTSNNLFGGSSPANTSNLFGGSSNASSTAPSLFGGLSSGGAGGNTSSLFGGGAATGSIFGTPAKPSSEQSPSSTGIFGNKQDTPNVFGAKPDATKGVDLSASKDLPSFASLGSSTGFSFGKKTEGFAFEGAGASVFGGGANKSATLNKSEDGGAENAEDGDHDPHFEPIIPLPELVNVTTGEEEEETVFKHRAKVYRFDKESKQWKERGVGDIKILYHPTRHTSRVLLRRDQVHKIACNHYITIDQQLEPMASSETALTWFAMDFSEDEANGLLEKLAVRFKLAETKDEFKKAFEEAQEKIKKNPPTPATKADKNEEVDDDDAEYEDEETNDEDQSDDTDNTLFERICELKEVIADKGSEINLGQVLLKILYDEDVYGARIIAVKVTDNEVNEDENYLCNHLIAMQTNLDVDEETRGCTWSALDFSVDPPRYRKFVAVFPDGEGEEDAQMEFVSVFQEGKDLAEQSEILEQPNAGGSLNPAEMYYGEGRDYED